MKDYKYELFITTDSASGLLTKSTKITQEEAVQYKNILLKLINSGYGYYWCVEDYQLDKFTTKRYKGILTPEEITIINKLIRLDDYGYCSCIEKASMVPLRNEIIIL